MKKKGKETTKREVREHLKKKKITNTWNIWIPLGKQRRKSKKMSSSEEQENFLKPTLRIV